MKKRKRWRYYCDHCKKSGGSKFWMEKHEKECLLNPKRICNTICHDEYPQESIDDLAYAATLGIVSLRNKSSGCPACMVAAIRHCEGNSKFNTLPESVQNWRSKDEWGEFNARVFWEPDGSGWGFFRCYAFESEEEGALK